MHRLTITLAAFILGISLHAAPPVATINESFFTTEQPRENIDSPAAWHGPDGRHWLLATSKAGHTVNIYDATNGVMLRRAGGPGDGPGQFNRPNGIWVAGDYALVVERDNHRVQILGLPGLDPVATFGADELVKPYGLYVRALAPGRWHVYVTDSYETPAGETPPAAGLGRRVHLYEVGIEGRVVEGELIKTFGDTAGKGVLHIVESINGDPAHDRLLVADEDEDPARGLNIKIYDHAGRFTGRTIGDGVFKYQPEGIALLPTGERGGYWICTDQGKQENLFHLFDRETLAHAGTFRGAYTLNTDGVWLSPRPLPRYPAGIFYACDNDKRISAFPVAEILAALGLPPRAK